MGALQPGLPSPVAVPEEYNIIVIDLQDCFFTIPLSAEDKKRFVNQLQSYYIPLEWLLGKGAQIVRPPCLP